jgi:hypothetical protein
VGEVTRWPVVWRISQGVEILRLFQKAFCFPNAAEGTPNDNGQTLLVGRQIVQTCHTGGFMGSMNEKLRGTTGWERAIKRTQLLDFSAASDPHIVGWKAFDYRDPGDPGE